MGHALGGLLASALGAPGAAADVTIINPRRACAANDICCALRRASRTVHRPYANAWPSRGTSKAIVNLIF